MTISQDALALTRSSDVIDLHIEGLMAPRLLGYDFTKRHGIGPFWGFWIGHLDYPRILEGGLTGAMWSITTNPLRQARRRHRAFLGSLETLRTKIAATTGAFQIARSYSEYISSRRAGAHACLLALQGANALEAAPDGPRSIPDSLITRVTLVHLTSSVYGTTSSPLRFLGAQGGLTTSGKDMVSALDDCRILVDLAHINPAGFWDAVAVHDRALPLVATHTGVSSVKPHWRNLDDRQIKAIADSGGTVGIIFSRTFTQVPGGPRDAGMVIAHMEHVIAVAGEDFVSMGSDFDGFIVPPPDLRSAACYPRLVEHMLARRWSEARIRKVLGGNALRVLQAIRP